MELAKLNEEAHVRPYISIGGGATHVDSINIHTTSEIFSTQFTLLDGPFYDDSWVWTGSVLLGVEIPITCHLAVGLDAGVRYESTLDQNDSELHRTGRPFFGSVTFLRVISKSLECSSMRTPPPIRSTAAGRALSCLISRSSPI